MDLNEYCARHFPGIVFFGKLDFTLLRLEGMVERITGYSPDDFLSGRMRWDEIIHPKDMRTLKGYHELGAIPDYSIQREYRIIKKDESIRWIHETISNKRNEDGKPEYVHGIMYDISEKKELQSKLNEYENRYKKLIENTNQGVLVAEIESKKFLYANEAISNLLGYSREELISLTVADIHPQESVKSVINEFVIQAQKGKSTTYNIPCLRKDGSIIHVDINTTPIAIEGVQCNVGFFTDNTERIAVEKALKESEKRFNQAMDAVDDGLWEWNLTTGEAFFSPKYYIMLGYEPDEFPATYDSWKHLVHPDDLQHAEEQIQEHIKEGKPFEIEFRLKTKGGEYKWILGRGKVMTWNRNGEPERMLGTHIDITDRKASESVLKAQVKLLERLNAHTKNVALELSVQSIIQTTVNELVYVLKPNLTVIYLLEQDQLVVKGMFTEGLHFGRAAEMVHRKGECLCGLTADQDQIHYSLNIHDDPRCTRPECKNAGITSFVSLPLREGSDVLGVIGIGSIKQHDFQEHKDFLESIATITSTGIVNARLYRKVSRSAEMLEQQVLDRTRELEKTKFILEEAERIAGIGAWEWDVENDTLSFSEQWMNIHGIIEKPRNMAEMKAIIPTEDLANLEKEFAKALRETGVYDVQHRIQRSSDYTIRQVHVRGEAIRDESGKSKRVIGVTQDVTEIKEMEQTLQEQRDISSALAEAAGALLAPISVEIISQKVLETALRLTDSNYGYVGYIDKETGHLVVPTMNKEVLSGCSVTKENFVFKDFSGLWGWVLLNREVLMTNDAGNDARSTGVPDGHVPIRSFLSVPAVVDGVLVGQIALANSKRRYTQQDMSVMERLGELLAIGLQRWFTETSLAKSEQRFRTLFEEAAEAITLHDHNGVVLDANPYTTRMLGYSLEELKDKDFGSLIASEDMQDAAAEYLKLLKGETTRAEYTFIRKDGKRILVETQGTLVDDYLLGLHRDMTERRKNEENLRQLERAVEHSPSSIVITDIEGIIEYVNPAFTRVTGYEREEALGENPRVLKSGMHDLAFYEDMWDTISQGRDWRGQICNKKKNEELFWEQCSISPVKDTKGKITHYIAVKEDITEKKHLEKLQEDVERMMRHDLKSPLNGIINLPDLIMDEGVLNDAQFEVLELIRDSGRKMLNMINMSLDIYKMEIGKYDGNFSQVDLIWIINSIIQEYEFSKNTKNVTIEVVLNEAPVQEDDSYMIHSEETLWYFILSNLLGNAMDASNPGDTITVHVQDGEGYTVSVHNNQYVPEEIQEAFFDKYVTYGKTGGTGLGTYSAKLMVETLGGSITMQTSQDRGTTITITMLE